MARINTGLSMRKPRTTPPDRAFNVVQPYIEEGEPDLRKAAAVDVPPLADLEQPGALNGIPGHGAIVPAKIYAEDLLVYSSGDLIELQQAIHQILEDRRADELDRLRSMVNAQASALGMSVQELLGLGIPPRKTRHATGPQPARYRGPNGEEWSGRGPNPRWMKPLLERGANKADFLIQNA